MPTKKVRIGIVVVLVLLGMLVGPSLIEPVALQTSYSKTPTGHRALLDLLEEHRPDVERWRRTPLSLKEHSPQSGTSHGLLMLEPKPELLSEGEAYHQAIVQWVRDGNDLILVPRLHEAAVGDLIGREFEFHERTKSYGSGIEAILSLAELEGELSASYGSSAQSPNRSSAQSPNRPFTTAESNQLLLPFVLELEERDAAFESVLVASNPDGEPVELVVDAAVGAGRIAIVLAPGLFWNKGLAEVNSGLAVGDNGFVAVNLLSEYGRDGLLIDEYYHGLTAIDGLMTLLITEPFLWLTLSFLFLATLVTWRSLVRSEPLVEPPLPTRRSKREHIDAMGRLIATSGENSWVMDQVLHGLQAEVRSCLRLDPSTHIDSVQDFLRRSDETLADRFRSLIEQAPGGPSQQPTDQAAVEWGRKSHAFLRDLHGSRKAGARSHKPRLTPDTQ